MTLLYISFIDINECATNNGGCAQYCTNTLGTYSCSCDSGYTLNIDGHKCTGMHNIEFI